MSIATVSDRSPVFSEYSHDEDFQELIEMFVGSMSEKIVQINEALSTGNHDRLKTYAHQLKGSGAGYGYPRLSEIAAELECCCKGHLIEEIPYATATLLNYMKRVSM
jgi:HPt (histidine-containing phosphotransfer) domain-containing protein